MKRLIVVLVLGCCLVPGLSSSALGQVPRRINYQGRLAQGTNLVNGAVALSLRLYDAPAGGTLLYEDSNSVTVVDGLYATLLGDNTVAGDLDDALIRGQVWLEVAVQGGALAPRELISSVAYARQVEGLRALPYGTIVLSPAWSNTVHSSAYQSVIGGGLSNHLGDTWRSVLAGGHGNFVGDFADYAAIGGGRRNEIRSSATRAAIGGGESNVVNTNASYAAIPGGLSNEAGAPHTFAAGRRARALHTGSFVWGDSTDAPVDSTASNQVTFRAGGGFRVLGGALSGDAGGLTNFPAVLIRNASATAGALSLSTNNAATAAQAAALGGALNVASGPGAAVAGGIGNIADGVSAVVAGGGGLDFSLFAAVSNRALGDFSFVGGGGDNTASGRYASVVGGRDNLAGGAGSVVPGGVGNRALGTFSLAAGRRAGALHEGAFVWADAQDADFDSTGTNQFLVRASGGFGLNTVAPSATLHVVGSPTLGSLLVAPAEAASGDDAELVLAEDDTGDFGMRLLYDGGVNQFRILGVQSYSNRGPHLVVARDSGLVGIGTNAPAAQLHVLGGDSSTPVLRVEGAAESTTGAVGAAAAIVAGDGGPGGAVVTAGTGGRLDLAAGDAGAGGFGGAGGDAVVRGGASSGFGAGGDVYVHGGGGFEHGNVFLALATNGAVRGQVAIATTNVSSGYKLSVGGAVRCTEVVVETGWADFVFEPGYALRPLAEVQRHIDAHGRLPGVPAAADVHARGIGVGEAQTLLLQKVEELTLYLLQQQRELEALRAEVKHLRGDAAR
jgi:hypothetical protein